MKKILDIIGGWTNVVYDKIIGLPPEVREEVDRKLMICHRCPVRSGNRCDPAKSSSHMETRAQTRGCGCIITAKAMSPGSQCPLAKW